MDPWTIPFNNTTYICWRDRQNRPRHRIMTEQEEREYFSSDSKENYLNELLRK